MATEAQATANHENAQAPSRDTGKQKSTGPKTQEGKARSARNALKHGLRARVILDYVQSAEHEQPKPFADLLSDLVAELAPVGIMEEYCVETIAVTMWRLRRVIAEELNLLDELHVDAEDSRWLDDLDRQPGDPDPGPIIYVALPPAEKLQPLMRYEAHLDRQKERAYKQLRELQAARRSAAAPSAALAAPESGTEAVRSAGNSSGNTASRKKKSPNKPARNREADRDPYYIPKHLRYEFGDLSGCHDEKQSLTTRSQPASPESPGPAFQCGRSAAPDHITLAGRVDESASVPKQRSFPLAHQIANPFLPNEATSSMFLLSLSSIRAPLPFPS